MFFRLPAVLFKGTASKGVPKHMQNTVKLMLPSITVVILVRLWRNAVSKTSVWLHRGNLERPAEFGTSALQPFSDMNSAQMILLSNSVSGRIFSSLWHVQVLLHSVCAHYVLGLRLINTFKHNWEKTKVQLITANEILKECAEGAEHTWNHSPWEKKQRFHFMPIHNWLSKVKLI